MGIVLLIAVVVAVLLRTPSRPYELIPPVGQGIVLPPSEIRYCLAEKIRMDGAKSAFNNANNYSGSDVDRFNAMVGDYNSRCERFQYRRGELESARSYIERYRSQLWNDGRNRFVR